MFALLKGYIYSKIKTKPLDYTEKPVVEIILLTVKEEKLNWR
jgi:hypothetical protein